LLAAYPSLGGLCAGPARALRISSPTRPLTLSGVRGDIYERFSRRRQAALGAPRSLISAAPRRPCCQHHRAAPEPSRCRKQPVAGPASGAAKTGQGAGDQGMLKGQERLARTPPKASAASLHLRPGRARRRRAVSASATRRPSPIRCRVGLLAAARALSAGSRRSRHSRPWCDVGRSCLAYGPGHRECS
jgi:hypothetical protein